jgi:hypothetical protein
VHEAVEISKFLKVLGPQKIQCTLTLNETTVSFIFETTNDAVKYVKVTHGREKHSTVNLDVDLNWLAKPSLTNLPKTPAYLLKNNMSPKKLWNTLKLVVAVSTEVVASNVSKPRHQK